MFERPQSGERALIVHVNFTNSDDRLSLPEFELLASSAGAIVNETVTTSRAHPDPKTFIGSGKLAELKSLVKSQEIEVLLFNHALSPSQERNLEASLSCRVLDRTGLILDIFAQRARTFEGKLQVELAQLEHLATRLVRGWTHLERQKGGIGLRGPGEKQLETDRRLLRVRVKTIRQRLEKVRKQRQQGSAMRRKGGVPVVALVGYTNAGKSTLFNLLTDSEVYVQNKLFATLDPTMRQQVIPGLGQVIFVDTVGFIQGLPHELVDAFRATLEETLNADLLLHVIDASDDDRYEKVDEVRKVLEEIGADGLPQIEVFNKIDKLAGVEPRLEQLSGESSCRVWMSAAARLGVSLCHDALQRHWQKEIVHVTLRLLPTQGNFRHALYECGAVVDEVDLDSGEQALRVVLLKSELEVASRATDVDWRTLIQ